MCRLLAVLSSDRVNAPYFLEGAPQSLLRQSAIDPKRKQSDGWGVGWFTENAAQVRKSPGVLYRQRGLFKQVGRRICGHALIGHVRWASNPLRLPRRALIGLPHTQPFVHGRWIFAHNGTLFIPKEVRAQLGTWATFIQGHNDSEVLFYWLLKHMPFLGDKARPILRARVVAMAVRRSLRDLEKIWRKCRRHYPHYSSPYHGLNCLFTDGQTLIAFCLVGPRGFDQTKALCCSSQPYYQMQRLQTEKAVVVASEPLDPAQPWAPFEHGELIVAHRSGVPAAREGVEVSRDFL